MTGDGAAAISALARRRQPGGGSNCWDGRPCRRRGDDSGRRNCFCLRQRRRQRDGGLHDRCTWAATGGGCRRHDRSSLARRRPQRRRLEGLVGIGGSRRHDRRRDHRRGWRLDDRRRRGGRRGDDGRRRRWCRDGRRRNGGRRHWRSGGRWCCRRHDRAGLARRRPARRRLESFVGIGGSCRHSRRSGDDGRRFGVRRCGCLGDRCGGRCVTGAGGGPRPW